MEIKELISAETIKQLNELAEKEESKESNKKITSLNPTKSSEQNPQTSQK